MEAATETNVTIGATGTNGTSVRLSGLQKAAILLVSLGEQASASLIKQFSEEEAKAVGKSIARLESVDAGLVEAVVDEFSNAVKSSSQAARGGYEFASKVLTSAFGLESGKRLSDDLPRGSKHARKLDVLQKADPNQLSRFIEGEHPQTIALILAHLVPAQASSLLAELPEEIRFDVTVRLAELDRVSPEVVHSISAVIGEMLSSVGEFKSECYGGPRATAEILNRMDSQISESILNGIEDQQTLVDAIRHYMFVFDDLLLLDDTAMKEVLQRIDKKLLIIALKGTSDQLKDHFLKCMSKRAADMLREDMEVTGPVRIKDVEVAQQEILSEIRRMESEGVVSLSGGGKDQYVS